MKKPADKKKKKKTGRKRSHGDSSQHAEARVETPVEAGGEEAEARKEPKKIVSQPPVKKDVAKRPEKKKGIKRSIGAYASMALHFFRDAKAELKKVKWPTRKELLASTAMVIVLALLAAVYLGVIDFGLIKIIRLVVG
jgi:preprotein translocase subunit SecE